MGMQVVLQRRLGDYNVVDIDALKRFLIPVGTYEDLDRFSQKFH